MLFKPAAILFDFLQYRHIVAVDDIGKFDQSSLAAPERCLSSCDPVAIPYNQYDIVDRNLKITLYIMVVIYS